MQADDITFLREAVQLARLGEGLTRPNPPVGAVLVADGDIIGRGYHQKAGGPHAEIEAICNAHEQGHEVAGATLYVTLEPCSTTGRTPPCTDAIIDADIRRVVAGAIDPNPQQHSGANQLEAAGIKLKIIELDETRQLIEPFAWKILFDRPFVTLKLGMTLDGQIADAEGQSKWITGQDARMEVQAMRRRADAILAGTETLRADNPSLLPRPANGRKPWRVVIDRQQNLSPHLKVFTDKAKDQTLIMRDEALSRILRRLARRDVMHLLVEGGGVLAASLIRENLVDEFVFFYAPSLLGSDGRPGIGAGDWRLNDRPELVIRSVEQIGDDIRVVARPQDRITQQN